MSQPIKEFKLIVAGGRTFSNPHLLQEVVTDFANSKGENTAVSIVTGMAKGADMFAYEFAKQNNIVTHEFPADWNNIDVPNALVRYRNGKPYNTLAGINRNHVMGDFADGLIAFWDGQSRGTKDMINYMKSLNKEVHIVYY